MGIISWRANGKHPLKTTYAFHQQKRRGKANAAVINIDHAKHWFRTQQGENPSEKQTN